MVNIQEYEAGIQNNNRNTCREKLHPSENLGVVVFFYKEIFLPLVQFSMTGIVSYLENIFTLVFIGRAVIIVLYYGIQDILNDIFSLNKIFFCKRNWENVCIQIVNLIHSKDHDVRFCFVIIMG